MGNYIGSLIGRKQVVGVTGLALCLFLFAHVTGNFLLFVSDRAYNMYSHALISNPFIYVAEIGLLAMLFGHMIQATYLSLKNRAARPVKYAVQAKGEKKTSNVTKFMWQQGVIILVFLGLHLLTFKYGEIYWITYDELEVRDLHRLVMEVFQSPAYVGGYIFALIVLGLHLSHGFQSTFKTLGFNHPKYEPKLKLIGLLFAVYVSVGFIIQPLYVFFKG